MYVTSIDELTEGPARRVKLKAALLAEDLWDSYLRIEEIRHAVDEAHFAPGDAALKEAMAAALERDPELREAVARRDRLLDRGVSMDEL